MATIAVRQATTTIALVGNPNTGKSTLFTALAGVRQRIGNYPGVTVEKKIGHLRHADRDWALVDLPGTYSLAPHSLDEMVAVDLLLGRRAGEAPCDAVICIVDAANLERNLYLVSQVLELGLPTVIALNMIDVAKDRGLTIDTALLSKNLGIPVVPVQANKHHGLTELKAALDRVIGHPRARPTSPFPPAFCDEVSRLEQLINGTTGDSSYATSNAESNRRTIPRYLAERLLLDRGGYLEQSDLFRNRRLESAVAIGSSSGDASNLAAYLQTARARLSDAGFPVPAIEAISRYQWVGRVLEGVVTRPSSRATTVTDRIDRVLTHRLWGTVIFALVMFALFSSIFVAAQPLMKVIDGGFKAIEGFVESHMAEGALRSLVVDGMIAGVGSVIVFLPQILILFMFIAILEDCGYMARAAYLMDKLMVRVGLSGKSFIPLLSSFACAIPGIMATRVIENRRDRLTTILVAPLMSCSARLPVYTLLIGAFIPAGRYVAGFLPLQGLTLFAMYLVGIVAAIVVALILKRTILKGETPPFVMELPPYKMPSAILVLHRMTERGWSFIKRAGTLIVAVAIIVWALLYYPHNSASVEQILASEKTALTTELNQLPSGDERSEFLQAELKRFDDPDQREQLVAGAYQRQSILGHMGHWIEPAVRPLGLAYRLRGDRFVSSPRGCARNLGGDV